MVRRAAAPRSRRAAASVARATARSTKPRSSPGAASAPSTREAAGHRLRGHVAVGLAHAREQEHVARGVVLRQFESESSAGEVRRRQLALELRPRRPVADDDDTHSRLGPLHGRRGEHHEVQVLLRREPPHVQGHRIVRPRAPGGAQRLASPPRVEARQVDAARHDEQPIEADLHEFAAHRFGRHHRARRAVVELAQIGQHRPRQPAHPVVTAVRVEVRAEFAAHGQAQPSGGLQGRPAEGALGGDVNQVRSAPGPQRHQRCLGGDTHLEAGIARHRQPAHQHLVEALRGLRALPGLLSRPHQLHVVIALAKPLHHARKGQGHTVHFRRIGLGHDGDAKVRGTDGEVVDFDRGGLARRDHTAIVASSCSSLMTRDPSCPRHAPFIAERHHAVTRVRRGAPRDAMRRA